MNNNELNNNTNNAPNIGGEILMGDAPVNNLNQNMQPQNNLNLNQGINTVLQNNMNQAQKVQTPETNNTQQDTIFSDVSQPSLEPLQSVPEQVQPQPTIEPTPTQEPLIPETPKEKKNKGPMIVIILLIIMVLGLAGYIVYDKFIPKDTTTKIEDTTKKEVTKKVLLKDENQEVVYSDVDEKHEGKIKRIPYININSNYAEEINNEIKTMVNKGLDGQATEMAYTTDYQYYINGEVVSVKFSWEMEGENSYTKIYNINQFTGKKVSNSELLKNTSINESELNNKMVESYKTARPLESINNNSDAMVKDCYQKDIDALSSGKIKGMYLSDNNELCILFDVNYIAGAGIKEAILNVTSNKVFLNPVTMQ